jgi:hypothetical protein
MAYASPEKARRAWKSPRAKATAKKYRESAKGRAASRRGRERTKQWALALRKMVTEIKSRPCADCGGTFDPVCMDFDHRPGEVKVAEISHLIARGAIDTIKAEIAKCDIVCANCHRVRTYRKRDHKALVMRTQPQTRGVDPDAQLGLPLPCEGDDEH